MAKPAGRIEAVGEQYRIHVTIRRKGQPVFTSHEFKTEEYDSLADLNAYVAEFVTIEVIDDEESSNYE